MGNVAKCVNAIASKVKKLGDTNLTTLYTAPANGAIISGINITSDDTSAQYIQFYVNDPADGVNAFDCPLGNYAVPITAGMHATAATATVDGLDTTKTKGLAKDNTTKSCIRLAGGMILKAKMTAITGGKFVNIFMDIQAL